MHQLLLTALTTLVATTALGQNGVSITQQSSAINAVLVTESGEGISQTDGETTDNSKPGSQVSVRVLRGIKTSINQHNRGDGPFGLNSIEVVHPGKATATITQSVETGDTRIRPLPVTPTNHSRTTRPNGGTGVKRIH